MYDPCYFHDIFVNINKTTAAYTLILIIIVDAFDGDVPPMSIPLSLQRSTLFCGTFKISFVSTIPTSKTNPIAASKWCAIWQCKNQTPGLSARKRNTNQLASTENVSRLNTCDRLGRWTSSINGLSNLNPWPKTQNVYPWRWSGCPVFPKSLKITSTTFRNTKMNLN